MHLQAITLIFKYFRIWKKTLRNKEIYTVVLKNIFDCENNIRCQKKNKKTSHLFWDIANINNKTPQRGLLFILLCKRLCIYFIIDWYSSTCNIVLNINMEQQRVLNINMLFSLLFNFIYRCLIFSFGRFGTSFHYQCFIIY